MCYVKLSEVCDILNGYSFESSKYVEDGIRIIRIANVQKGYIDDTQPVYYPFNMPGIEKFMLKDGDLVMSLTGNVGRVAIIEKSFLPAALNQRVACLRPDESKMLVKYLYHFLNSDNFILACTTNSNGIAQKNMSTEWLKKYPIKICDICMQSNIVKILDNVQSLINKTNKVLDSLDLLVKSQFVEMFGDRYTNNKNFPMKSLGSSMFFVNGKAHEQYISDAGNYIVITSRAIASDLKDVRKSNDNLCPLYKGDIVMVMSDVPNGRALAKCLLLKENNKFTLNQRICAFRNYDYNSEFLFSLLNRHKYFLSFDDGDSQTNLRKEDILNCMLINPPKNLQCLFSAFVKQIDKSKYIKLRRNGACYTA